MHARNQETCRTCSRAFAILSVLRITERCPVLGDIPSCDILPSAVLTALCLVGIGQYGCRYFRCLGFIITSTSCAVMRIWSAVRIHGISPLRFTRIVLRSLILPRCSSSCHAALTPSEVVLSAHAKVRGLGRARVGVRFIVHIRTVWLNAGISWPWALLVAIESRKNRSYSRNFPIV